MATTNPFDGLPYPPNSPYVNGAPVTPSDTVVLSPLTRALWIGTTGNLTVTMSGGAKITLLGVPVGELRISVSQVWSTGTTASNIVAFW